MCGTWAGALQAPLLALLNDPQCSVRLNARPYNLVSYPWSIRYQQSNHWALETLASAVEPGITHHEQAQAWLKFKGYQASGLLTALKPSRWSRCLTLCRFEP